MERSKYLLLFLVFILLFGGALSFAEEPPRQTANSDSSERKRAEIPSEKGSDVDAVADDLEFFREENKLVGRGNVVVRQKDVRLVADQAEVFTDTKKAYAEGHVTISRGALSISGDKAYYDFANHQGSFPKGQITYEPFFIRGEQIEQVSKNQINMYQPILTTCPLPQAHYDITGSRATIYPGDKIVVWNITFRILKFPVFWWPYLIIPLDQESGPFDIAAGQSKSYGSYVFVGKTFSVVPQAEGRELKTKMHVNYYKKRGKGYGNETWYHLNKVGDGYLSLFDIKDSRAPDPFYYRADQRWRKKERYRVTWKHRTDFDEHTNLITQFNGFSDPHVLPDFFQKEFDEEPIPQTFLTYTRNAKHYGLLVDIQRQANNFDNVTERLPEVRFNWNSTEVKNTGIYYENETSYTNFHSVAHTYADDPVDDTGQRRLVTETRQHLSQASTFHEISYPKKYFRYYELTPHASTRWTYFDHLAISPGNDVRKHAIPNALGLGGELNTRFYRFFEIPKGSIAGIRATRIRHVMKPIITYTSIRQSTLRPAHVPALGSFNGISDVIQFGLENRLQTKSGDQRIDIVSLNTFANYEFNNPNNDTRWTTGNVELILRPYSWFQCRTQVDIDLKQHRRTGSISDIVITTKYVDLKLNHRYAFTTKESLDSDRFFKRETNVITFDGNARLNDRWSAGGYFRWEVKRHSWREYEWRITRDLHDWVLNIGENIRHSDINWLNHELFFELQLKAFPGMSFSTGQRAQFPEARIGETVSGANIAPPPPSLLG